MQLHERPAPGTFFCFDQWSAAPLQLPFAWERLAVISTARDSSRREHVDVVVGRAVAGEPR